MKPIPTWRETLGNSPTLVAAGAVGQAMQQEIDALRARLVEVEKDAELGKTAMRFVDRAGDVHPGIDDAETICADFYKAMVATLEKNLSIARGAQA